MSTEFDLRFLGNRTHVNTLRGWWDISNRWKPQMISWQWGLYSSLSVLKPLQRRTQNNSNQENTRTVHIYCTCPLSTFIAFKKMWSNRFFECNQCKEIEFLNAINVLLSCNCFHLCSRIMRRCLNLSDCSHPLTRPLVFQCWDSSLEAMKDERVHVFFKGCSMWTLCTEHFDVVSEGKGAAVTSHA